MRTELGGRLKGRQTGRYGVDKYRKYPLNGHRIIHRDATNDRFQQPGRTANSIELGKIE